MTTTPRQHGKLVQNKLKKLTTKAPFFSMNEPATMKKKKTWKSLIWKLIDQETKEKKLLFVCFPRIAADEIEAQKIK
jgi:hypothetical protein